MNFPAGPVTRCRGPFLYTAQGRWLDLDRLGGRALLGWNDPKVMSRYRNELARGLTGPYPSFWPKRFVTLIRRLYSGTTARPLHQGEVLPIARPFGEISVLPCELILPDLGLGIRVVLEAITAAVDLSGYPASAIAASCAALGALESSQTDIPAHWQTWEHPLFTRIGPWLRFRGNEKEWLNLRATLLAERIFIPEHSQTPLCLPWDPVPAEQKRWTKLLAGFKP